MNVQLKALAANLVKALKMQRDDRRQRGYQHLLPGAGVNLLPLLIYRNNKATSQACTGLWKEERNINHIYIAVNKRAAHHLISR